MRRSHTPPMSDPNPTPKAPAGEGERYPCPACLGRGRRRLKYTMDGSGDTYTRCEECEGTGWHPNGKKAAALTPAGEGERVMDDGPNPYVVASFLLVVVAALGLIVFN
jgi:hypothetical protein